MIKMIKKLKSHSLTVVKMMLIIGIFSIHKGYTADFSPHRGEHLDPIIDGLISNFGMGLRTIGYYCGVYSLQSYNNPMEFLEVVTAIENREARIESYLVSSPTPSRINPTDFLDTSLPAELWTHVFSHLPLKDLLQIRLVCKAFKNQSVNRDKEFPRKLFFFDGIPESRHVGSLLLFYPNITTLSLEYKQSQWIPYERFALLTNLKTLNLKGNMPQIPAHFFSNTVAYFTGSKGLPCLQSLTELNLERNRNIHHIKLLTNLTCLNLDENEMISNGDLLSLTKLRSLTLQYNKKILTISYLVNLTSLNLSYNNTIEGEELFLLTNLKKLTLSGDSYIYKKHLSPLTHLRKLCLGNTPRILGGTPFIKVEDITMLTGLTELVIPLTKITTKEMEFLSRLKSLGTRTIRDNDLSTLTNLTKLNLRDNVYVTDHGISGLTNLKKLDVSFSDDSNKANITYNSFSHLTNLTKLVCYYAVETSRRLTHLTKLTTIIDGPIGGPVIG